MFHPETLKRLLDTAVQAAGAKVLEIPGDGRTVKVANNGKIETYNVPPKPRDHHVSTLDDLLAYVTQSAIPAVTPCGPVLWHSPAGVVLVVDDADRRDRVTFPLTECSRFRTLRMLEEPRPLQQRAFIRLLKVDLGVDAAIVNKFRRLDWKDAATLERDAQKNKDRLGRQVMQEVVAQGDELQDELIVNTPVYLDLGEREQYRVLCTIEPDFEHSALVFSPAPDELEQIVEAHQQSIRARIEDFLKKAGLADRVPVYYGKP